MKKFEGLVNGVKYTSREDYNEAVKEAFNKDGAVNASFTFTEEPDEVQFGQSLENILSRFDLDQLDGSNDDELLEAAKNEYTLDNAKKDAKLAKDTLSEEDQHRFVDEILNNIKDINDDIRHNEGAAEIATHDVESAENIVKKITAQLDQAKKYLDIAQSKNNILKNAHTVLNLEKEYFEAMIKKTDDQVPENITEDKPTDDTEDTFSGVQKLLNEIFDMNI